MKAAAEGRKKLIDNSKKHHSTEDSSGKYVYIEVIISQIFTECNSVLF